MTSLDPEILSAVEMSPVEDLVIELLRQRITTVPIQTLVADRQEFPLILVRSSGGWGNWDGDERFIDSVLVEIHTLASGLNADEDANLLSEAVRVALRDSRNIVVPNRGHIVAVEMVDRPRRRADWATAVGPVQYADLPAGVERWEALYRLTVRKPANRPFP